MSDDPVALKDRGNLLFAKGKFEEAATCYQCALTLLSSSATHKGKIVIERAEGKEESQEQLLYLKAVCHSNHSNCQFELGKYAESILEADKSLLVIRDTDKQEDETMKAKFEGLCNKNILRIARASFYQQDYIVCQEALDKLLLAGDECDAYAKRASKMLRQIHFYQKQDNEGKGSEKPTCSTKPVRLLRPAWQEPNCEYFKFGHDPAMSALKNELGKDKDNNDQDHPNGNLHLKVAPKLSILMSGINDGRHVLTTIMDIFEQYTDLDSDRAASAIRKSDVKAQIVCNDINRASMARFVIVMVILSKIGSMARSTAELKDGDNKASRWCTVLQYVYLSYAMPPWCNTMLLEVMAEINAYPSRAAFQSDHAWLPSSDDDWELITPILAYWIHQASILDDYTHECNYPPNWNSIPGVKESLDKHWKYECEEEGRKKALEAMSSKSVELFKEKEQAARASTKNEMMASLIDRSGFTPEMIEMMRQSAGPGQSLEDEITGFLNYAQALPDKELTDLKLSRKQHLMKAGIPFAVLFVKRTKVLLPPKQHCDHPIFEKIYLEDEKITSLGGHLSDKDAKTARQVVDKTWRTNPCMFDPLEFSNNASSAHGLSPVIDFLNDFSSVDFCKEPIQDECILTLTRTLDSLKAAQFSDWTHCYFWNAAHALVSLCKEQALSVKWSVGDIISTCQTIRADTTQNIQFHRILASNIPDYTGMLPFFTEVLPLLHDPTESVTSTFGVNILLNTPLWNDYAHYIYSSTAIPGLEEVENILGMKHMGDNGTDAWSHFYWTKSKKSTKKATKIEFCTWLQRLFLSIILPADREAQKMFLVESCPSTVATFLRVCVFCVEQLDYPIHWVSGALDELLVCTAQKQLKTKAQVPTKSPTEYQEEKAPKEVNISAFVLDLRTQVTLNLQTCHSNIPCFRPLETASLRNETVNRYEVAIPTNLTPRARGLQHGDPHSSCLAIVLERTKPASLNKLEVVQMNQAFLRGARPQPKSIRNQILEKGSKSFHVLSCIDWELVDFGSTNRLCFYMAQSDFQLYKNYYISVLRTDGWFRLGDPIQLSKAKQESCSK